MEVVLWMILFVDVLLVFIAVPTLQAACRDAILQHTTKKAVSSLPLPKLLQKYLLYEV